MRNTQTWMSDIGGKADMPVYREGRHPQGPNCESYGQIGQSIIQYSPMLRMQRYLLLNKWDYFVQTGFISFKNWWWEAYFCKYVYFYLLILIFWMLMFTKSWPCQKVQLMEFDLFLNIIANRPSHSKGVYSCQCVNHRIASRVSWVLLWHTLEWLP